MPYTSIGHSKVLPPALLRPVVGTPHSKPATPLPLPAIEGVRCPLGFILRAQIKKAIVVVTRLEALGRMRGKQLANILTDNESATAMRND